MFKQSKLQPNKTQQYLPDSEMDSFFFFQKVHDIQNKDLLRILEILRKFPFRYNFDLIYVENVRTVI